MTPNDNTFATGYGPEWQLRNFGTALITHEEAEFQTGMEDAAPGYYLWDLGEAPEGPQSLKEAVNYVVDGRDPVESRQIRESVSQGLMADDDRLMLNLPFSGFYETVHGLAIEDALGAIFQHGGYDWEDPLICRAWDCVDFVAARNAYAREYVAYISWELFGVSGALQFECVDSPSEYNFHNDLIVVSAPRSLIQCLFSEVAIEGEYRTHACVILDKFAKNLCTSRSGFASFTNPDWREWGAVDGWNRFQLEMLFQAVHEGNAQCGSELPLHALEHYFPDHLRENGTPIEDSFFQTGAAEIARLETIAVYLSERAERESMRVVAS